MGQKDIAEKAFIGINEIFADIVNVLLFDGEQIVRPEELSDLDTFSAYAVGETLHEQNRDTCKMWRQNGINISIVSAENQTDVCAEMPIRIISYDGAAYRHQLDAAPNPNCKKKFIPVISIVLYFGKQKWNAPRSLFECIEIDETLKPLVNDYKIHVFEIPRLSMEQVNKFKSDFREVADYFVHKRTDDTYRGSDRQIKYVEAFFRLIAAVSGNKDMSVYASQLRERGLKTMWDMTSVYIKEGFEKGRSAGILEGRTAGFNAGILEGRTAGFNAGMLEGRNAGILEGRTAGFADGRSAGYNAGMFDVARNMRNDGKSDGEIIRYTGLPLSALENL